MSTPVTARASSVRPDPSRPATPSTSPSTGRRRPPDAARVVMPRAQRYGASVGDAHAGAPADRDVVAEHRLHQVDAQQLGGEVLADELAVAQDGDAVADLVDLVEEVRHEEDRHTATLEVADDAEELADSSASRLEVGSSRTSTRRSAEMARAIATSCWTASE